MVHRSIVIKIFRYHSERITTEQKKNILNRDFNTTGINQKWCTDSIISKKKQGRISETQKKDIASVRATAGMHKQKEFY